MACPLILIMINIVFQRMKLACLMERHRCGEATLGICGKHVRILCGHCCTAEPSF